MNVPGSARSHVWVGLLVALMGVFVGGYAYTGERVYDLWFVGVAVLGLVLVLGGGLLAAYGQANRPRLGGVAKARKDEEDEEESVSWGDRLRGFLGRFGKDEDEEGGGERLSVEMRCPSCGTSFSRVGRPPFEAACPACGFEDSVEAPAP